MGSSSSAVISAGLLSSQKRSGAGRDAAAADALDVCRISSVRVLTGSAQSHLLVCSAGARGSPAAPRVSSCHAPSPSESLQPRSGCGSWQAPAAPLGAFGLVSDKQPCELGPCLLLTLPGGESPRIPISKKLLKGEFWQVRLSFSPSPSSRSVRNRAPCRGSTRHTYSTAEHSWVQQLRLLGSDCTSICCSSESKAVTEHLPLLIVCWLCWAAIAWASLGEQIKDGWLLGLAHWQI